jgi:hypothetical protein
MTFWSKLGHSFKTIGSKVAGAASYLGHKTAGVLNAFAPAVTAFNPVIGAGMMAAAGVAEGVGTLGDVGKSALSGGGVNAGHFMSGKAAVGQIKDGMVGVRSAYRQHKSGLERN